jgi:hypothetical protein
MGVQVVVVVRLGVWGQKHREARRDIRGRGKRALLKAMSSIQGKRRVITGQASVTTGTKTVTPSRLRPNTSHPSREGTWNRGQGETVWMLKVVAVGVVVEEGKDREVRGQDRAKVKGVSGAGTTASPNSSRRV